MKTWGKSLLLSAALLLAALSSASAWPSLRSPEKEASEMSLAVQSVTLQAEAESEATPVQISVEQEQEAATAAAMSPPSTVPASTEQQEQSVISPEEAEMLKLLAENPDGVRALLKDSLGGKAYEKIAPYIDIMISENNDACNRHDALAAEYNALASEHASLIDDSLGRDVDFIIAPEALYDITANQWGVGAALGISWKNLILTAGAEKMLGGGLGWDEGYRVRLGAGISL